ncbi:MAG: APC family permease [bacterium]|nr:APC family permease [bacterium]
MIQLKSSNFTSLVTAIFLGVGTIIGSGWLFASYYASKEAGGASILSWIVGAVLALLLALLLAEIATMFPIRGIFARLLVVSHNRDIGFVIAISNWVGALIIIPSEASATIQYISTVFPKATPYIFQNHEFTIVGLLLVSVLILSYTIINYWGIKSLSKFNNAITTFKVIIPLFTAIVILISSFHSSNFTHYHSTFIPYGVSSIFSTVVTSGIFYAFFGFQLIVLFASELKNPKKNIPISLISCIVLCLVIYLLLQIAFIGALPGDIISKGWAGMDFTSPLAQLASMLGLNFLMVILYLDACVSPSGTGIVYLGGASRMLTGMAEDKQMPKFFYNIHPIYNFSRRSLIFTTVFCLIVVWFFRNWQSIMILVTVFQLLSCVAVPIAFYKLRYSQPDKERPFRMKGGLIICVITYLVITYLLIQAGFKAVLANIILHLACFAIYGVIYHRHDIRGQIRSWLSSWSIFLYLLFSVVWTYMYDKINHRILTSPLGLIIFIIIALGIFTAIIKQKSFNDKDTGCSF